MYVDACTYLQACASLICIHTRRRVFTVSLKPPTLVGWLGCQRFAAGITTLLCVPGRDAGGDRVITGKKNVTLSRVSADFRHNGARVPRQAFLAN